MFYCCMSSVDTMEYKRNANSMSDPVVVSPVAVSFFPYSLFFSFLLVHPVAVEVLLLLGSCCRVSP